MKENNKTVEAKEKKRRGKLNVLKWVLLLSAVIICIVLAIGGTNNWFNSSKVVLDAKYYGGDGEFLSLSAEEYDKLIQDGESFVVLIDQAGCTTADRLREYTKRYMTEYDIVTYRMMFEAMKKTLLHDEIKYYPSVAIIAEGHVVGSLHADSDDDAKYYNNYDDFSEWMNSFLEGK